MLRLDGGIPLTKGHLRHALFLARFAPASSRKRTHGRVDARTCVVIVDILLSLRPSELPVSRKVVFRLDALQSAFALLGRCSVGRHHLGHNTHA